MAGQPEHIGPYRVLRAIAAGGTAEVYEVEDPASGERLAVKLLVSLQSSLRRFNREFEAMARLNHPTVVRVYHYGQHEGHPWISMELLRGVPAQQWIRPLGSPGEPARTQEALRIGVKISQALGYLHERGLVHRDLKSANILVLPDQRIKMLDFGAAHLIDAGERITEPGEFVGTFAYASPEQLQAVPLTGASDLYSLGVLLFRLLTGHRPFDDKDPARLAYQVIHKAPPDPRSLAPLSDALAELLLQLLAKAPNDRPPNAEEVARRLEASALRPFPTRTRVAIQLEHPVARSRERRRAWQVLEERNPGTTLIFTGDPGSDVGVVVRELSTEAEARGWRVWTLAERAGPRGLLDLFRAMAKGLEDPRARAALEKLDRLDEAHLLAHPRHRLSLRQLAAELARLRAWQDGRSGLLVVPNLADLGYASVELLAGVQRALVSDRVPLLFLMGGTTQAIEANLQQGQALHKPTVIHLDPLGQREVAVAVGTMLGTRPPPADLARRIHEATGGQPLWVERMVAALVEGGHLEAEEGRLDWSGQAARLPMVDSALASAEAALARQPAIHRRVLELMSLLGTPTPLPTLQQALGWETPSLAVVLRDLQRDTLIVVKAETVDWRQPALPRVVRHALPVRRRRWAEQRVGQALRGGEASAEQVKLLLETGEGRRAARQANTLAAAHLRQRRYREAIQLLEPVVEAVQQSNPAEAGLAAALLARALQASRPTDAATPKALSRARTLATPDPAHQAMLELTTAHVFVGIGHYRNFRKHLTAAWEHASQSGDPMLQAEVAMELGRSHRLHAELPAAESWFDRSYQLANTAGDANLAGRALVGQAGCLRASGRIAEGEARAARALHDLQWTDDKAAYWLALAAWTDLLRVQGRYTEALTLADQNLPAASQTEDRRTYLRLLIATAWCEVDLHRLGRAQELVEEILANLPRGEHPHIRLEAELLGAALQVASGQAREAVWSLQDSLTRARRAELTALAAQLQALLAEAQLVLGQKEASEENWREALLNLLGAGELTVTAEFAARRARGAPGKLDPARLFRPVARLLQEAPLEPIRIDRDLARVAWLKERGDSQEARKALDEALKRLQELMGGLGDTERAALRTHPWSAALRRSLS